MHICKTPCKIICKERSRVRNVFPGTRLKLKWWGHGVLPNPTHVCMVGWSFGKRQQRSRLGNCRNQTTTMLKSISRAVSIASRLTNKTATASATRTVEPLVRSALCLPNSAPIRPYTRSIWMMCNNGAVSGYRPKLFSSKGALPSSCGCGGLHTEGNLIVII